MKDKLYGTKEEYDELYSWIAKNLPTEIGNFYPYEHKDGGVHPIAYFSMTTDKIVLKSCPVEWVKAKIRQMYE